MQFGHIPMLQCQRRGEPQHIAQLIHSCELPVGAVATVAHGPGDEGRCRHRPEGDGGEPLARFEGILSNSGERVWKLERGEARAPIECIGVNLGQGAWEGEGGEPGAPLEGACVNSGHSGWKNEGGESHAALERVVADAAQRVRECDRG